MTIKEYVLDALSKFWTKLKGSYITPMQTEIDKLSFVEASTVESFYNKLEVRKDKTVMFFCTGDVTQVIIGNTNINLNLKGIVKCMDSANHIYDFICSDSYQNTYSFRTTFTSSTTCTVSNFKHLSQIYAGSYSSLYTYLSEINSLGPVLIRIDGTVSTILTDGACTAVCHGYVSAVNRSTHQYYIFLAQEDGWYWHINCVIPSNDETEYTLNKLRGNRIDAPLLWNGIEIAENADLNTFNKPGTYYCDQTVKAATLTNCPTNVAFVMYVNYTTGTGYPGQTIREYNSLKTYFRVQSSGTWGSWAHVYPITGAASTIETSNLTASRALISNSSGKVGVSSATTTELGYLSGVTSAIQTQINGKQASITGGASTITSSNLTASRALISNTSGKVGVSSATTTELGYLSGVTSAIQTQLNGKQATLAWSYTAQNSVADVTVTTANTFYKIGSNGVTFPAGKYLVIMHIQACCKSAGSDAQKSSMLRAAIGSSASDTGNSLRLVTVKPIGVNTTGYFWAKIVDLISFSSSTTYYGWITSSTAGTPVTVGCWIDAFKFA